MESKINIRSSKRIFRDILQSNHINIKLRMQINIIDIVMQARAGMEFVLFKRMK